MIPTNSDSSASENARELIQWLTTTDNRTLGILYIVFGVLAGLWGATDALMLRTGLLTPGADIWQRQMYNALFTTHGLTMLFFFATPVIFGLSIYILPLLIGSDNMAFPRISAIAFWMLPIALLLTRAGLLSSLLGIHIIEPPKTGWTLYVPLSTDMSNPELDLVLVGLFLNGISSILIAINIIVTIATERAEQTTWATLDVFSWSMLTTSGMILFAFPMLCAALVMLLLDRTIGTLFFTGQPLLWQHLFWFFGHPEVYILVLPPMGIISLILPKFAGRTLFGLGSIVYSTLAIGVLSFGVWGHHMFTTGIDPRLRVSFMAVTIAIAVPSAVKTFDWIMTLWNGRIRLTTPMLFCIGAIMNFVIGGVTGVFLAAIPIDVLYHGTYYVVGHFHLILVGTIVFGLFAASYYWFPLFTGRMYNKQLGKYHFWLTMIGVVITFNLLLVIGVAGLPRRMATYPPQFTLLQQFATISAYILGLSQLIWVWNMITSLWSGPEITDADVWNLKESNAFTREWEQFQHRLEAQTDTIHDTETGESQ